MILTRGTVSNVSDFTVTDSEMFWLKIYTVMTILVQIDENR